MKLCRHSKGYLYFCDSTHPLAWKGTGIVPYHRHVASMKLRRWLLPEEHVHHIDGDIENNDPNNLEIMTGSEHAQRHHKERGDVGASERSCEGCGLMFKPVNSDVRFCTPACYNERRRKFNPTAEDLKKRVWEMPSTKVGKFYGVSGKAIEKRCKLLGVSKPSRGYWAMRRALG